MVVAIRRRNKRGVRSQLSSNLTLKRDLISKLPDDILIPILSLLGLKEAARTCVLSQRWRNLWKSTSRLDFDDSLRLHSWRDIFKRVERTKFVNGVNNVLESHQGTKIEEFSLKFDADDEESCKSDIDRWLNFALENRVQKLLLDFKFGIYILTTQFLLNHKLDSITVLRLRSVQVTGEAVEQIFTHCPFLEVFSVRGSESLVHLRVCGPSLKLKHLEIAYCNPLEWIEISATSLVSFKYRGSWTSLFFYDLPNLVDASVRGIYAFEFLQKLSQFSSYISQLQTFELDLFAVNELGNYPEYPKFSNLMNLDLIIYAFGASNLLCFSSLLAVSPLLHKLKLQILAEGCFHRKYKMKQQEAKPHCRLKVVELGGGYIDFAIYIELARHLLKSAVSLEKLLIYHRPYKMGMREECADPKKTAIACAELETSLPPGAKLVVV